MPTFGVALEDLVTARDFIKKADSRLQNSHLIKNPFEGHFYQMGENNKFFVVMDVKTLYPSPIGIGVFVGAVMFILGASLIWFIIPSFIVFSSFFWSRYFHFLMLKLGMRKAGYMGDMSLLKQDETILRLLN